MQAWRWSGRTIAAALWLAAIAVFLLPTTAALRSPGSFAARAAVVLLAVAGLVRPRLAIAALAALAPIATYIAAQRGGPGSGWSEALVVAGCAGMLTHYAIGSRLRISAAALTDRLLLACVLLAATAMLSAAMLVLSERIAYPDQFAGRFWSFLSRTYIEERIAFRNVHMAAVVVEGMVLLACAAAAVRTAESRYTAARLFVAGAAAATLFTLLRIVQATLRSEAPVSAFLTTLRNVRYHAVQGDLNAAGSYLLLALFITAGFVIRAVSERRFPSAGFSTLLLAMLTLGLWFTGSRTALGTGVLVAAAWVVAHVWHRASRRVRVAAVIAAAAVVILTAVAVARFSQNQIIVSGVLFMRYEMARVSLRMLETAPLFGVGIGTFYERSAEFIRAPEVLLYYSRENAHNNLLQVLSELGIFGAGVFLWVLFEALWRLRLGIQAQPSDAILKGVAAGVAAFLLTALAGHPLLVAEVAYPFWIALGIGCAAAPLLAPSRAIVPQAIAAAAAALLLITIPGRTTSVSANANLEHVSHGTSGWMMSDDGVRYREFRGRGVFFVPANASVVSMDVRSPQGTLRIQVAWNGRPADIVQVSGTAWQELRLRVPPSAEGRRFEPMELQVVDPPERSDAPVHAGKVVVRTLRAQ